MLLIAGRVGGHRAPSRAPACRSRGPADRRAPDSSPRGCRRDGLPVGRPATEPLPSATSPGRGAARRPRADRGSSLRSGPMDDGEPAVRRDRRAAERTIALGRDGARLAAGSTSMHVEPHAVARLLRRRAGSACRRAASRQSATREPSVGSGRGSPGPGRQEHELRLPSISPMMRQQPTCRPARASMRDALAEADRRRAVHASRSRSSSPRPPPSPDSENANRPAVARDVGDRRTSRATRGPAPSSSPGAQPRIPERSVSCAIRTRPSRETSWSVRFPVTRASSRIRPGGRRRHRARDCRRLGAAVNQISRPSGDQARPPSVAKSLRQRRLLAGAIHDRDRAAVVAREPDGP